MLLSCFQGQREKIMQKWKGKNITVCMIKCHLGDLVFSVVAFCTCMLAFLLWQYNQTDKEWSGCGLQASAGLDCASCRSSQQGHQVSPVKKI